MSKKSETLKNPLRLTLPDRDEPLVIPSPESYTVARPVNPPITRSATPPLYTIAESFGTLHSRSDPGPETPRLPRDVSLPRSESPWNLTPSSSSEALWDYHGDGRPSTLNLSYWTRSINPSPSIKPEDLKAAKNLQGNGSSVRK